MGLSENELRDQIAELQDQLAVANSKIAELQAEIDEAEEFMDKFEIHEIAKQSIESLSKAVEESDQIIIQKNCEIGRLTDKLDDIQRICERR